jgi:MFS family permease
VPSGALADRYGPRGVLVAITVVRAAAMAGYLVIHGTWAFLAVTVLFTAPANGATAARTAMVAGLVPGDAERMRTLAGQRVAQHVGYAVGAGLGALVLSADRPSGYLAAIAGDAASFLVLAAVTATVPAVAPVARTRTTGARLVLRDRPYLAVVGATAVLSLCWAMLSTGLPLWISRTGRLPLSLSGAVPGADNGVTEVISSVGIAVLQVPAARLARGVGASARTAVWSGVALAASCVLLATTSAGPVLVAASVVIVASLFHVAGELGFVAASWGLSIP